MEPKDNRTPVRVMIVDDEINARNRLVDILSDLQESYPTIVVAEASNGLEALRRLENTTIDVVLCDVSMPEMDGLEFARHAKYLPIPPVVIFVTAFDDYAVKAFELNAIDYLVKPVRLQRLLEALKRVEPVNPTKNSAEDLPSSHRRYFNCVEMGRMLLVPIHKVCYLKSDDKYVQAVTHERDYWINETLSGVEKNFSDIFLRVHRSYIVAKKYIIGVQKNHGEQDNPFSLRLEGVEQQIPVSRRQWSTVRDYVKLVSGLSQSSPI